MSITEIALSLAKFVPDIVGWVAGDNAEKVATDVVAIAEKVTGKKAEDAVDAINSDPTLALAFYKMLMEDRNSAREIYKIHPDNSDKISNSVIRYNLWLVLFLVLADVAAYVLLAANPALLTALSTSTGFVIQSLLKERQDILGFYFGSSIGSKIKTLTGSK